MKKEMIANGELLADNTVLRFNKTGARLGLKANMICVYAILNLSNNKAYIGSTRNLQMRMRRHLGNTVKEKFSHLPLYKDLKEQGQENFCLKVLEYCEPDMLLEREQFYQEKYQPFYNNQFAKKGGVMHNRHGLMLTEAHYASVSERKRLYNTAEYKEKFSKIQDKRKRKVRIVELDKEFPSLMSAARFLKAEGYSDAKNIPSKIKDCIEGKRKSYLGLHYVEIK